MCPIFYESYVPQPFKLPLTDRQHLSIVDESVAKIKEANIISLFKLESASEEGVSKFN